LSTHIFQFFHEFFRLKYFILKNSFLAILSRFGPLYPAKMNNPAAEPSRPLSGIHWHSWAMAWAKISTEVTRSSTG
jgi:hypothetical protein